MTENPKISVIMACYNAAPYVQQSIRSVIEQSFSDWELIIVDDASQDDSLLYIQRAAQVDSRIRYQSSEVNRGSSCARNSAIDLARGEWLAILDADDIFLPDKLEKQFEIISKATSSLVLVGSGCFYIDSKGKNIKEYNYSTKSNTLKKNLQLMHKFPPHSSLIYRKTTFLAAGGFDAHFQRSEDYDLWLRLSKFGCFTSSPIPLIKYRLHPTNKGKTISGIGLDELTYAIAATVRYRIKEVIFADPIGPLHISEVNDFFHFVSKVLEQSGFRKYYDWRADLRNGLIGSADLCKRLKLLFIAAFQSLEFITPLIKEYFLRAPISHMIAKRWMSEHEDGISSIKHG